LSSTTAISPQTTTTHIGSLLRRYATFVENFVKRELDLGSIAARIEMGDTRELNSELWTAVDGYGEGGSEGKDEGGSEGGDEGGSEGGEDGGDDGRREGEYE
jgi:hypothetical protein